MAENNTITVVVAEPEGGHTHVTVRGSKPAVYAPLRDGHAVLGMVLERFHFNLLLSG